MSNLEGRNASCTVFCKYLQKVLSAFRNPPTLWVLWKRPRSVERQRDSEIRREPERQRDVHHLGSPYESQGMSDCGENCQDRIFVLCLAKHFCSDLTFTISERCELWNYFAHRTPRSANTRSHYPHLSRTSPTEALGSGHGVGVAE